MNIYEGAMQKFAKEEEVVPSEFENLLTAIETEWVSNCVWIS